MIEMEAMIAPIGTADAAGDVLTPEAAQGLVTQFETGKRPKLTGVVGEVRSLWIENGRLMARIVVGRPKEE
jgi:hypothetical protein